MSVVFDVPEEHMEGVKEVCDTEDWLDVCTELPPLKVKYRCAKRWFHRHDDDEDGEDGGGLGWSFALLLFRCEANYYYNDDDDPSSGRGCI